MCFMAERPIAPLTNPDVFGNASNGDHCWPCSTLDAGAAGLPGGMERQEALGERLEEKHVQRRRERRPEEALARSGEDVVHGCSSSQARRARVASESNGTDACGREQRTQPSGMLLA
jgi:hypothetical protein